MCVWTHLWVCCLVYCSLLSILFLQSLSLQFYCSFAFSLIYFITRNFEMDKFPMEIFVTRFFYSPFRLSLSLSLSLLIHFNFWRTTVQACACGSYFLCVWFARLSANISILFFIQSLKFDWILLYALLCTGSFFAFFFNSSQFAAYNRTMSTNGLFLGLEEIMKIIHCVRIWEFSHLNGRQSKWNAIPSEATKRSGRQVEVAMGRANKYRWTTRK